MQWNQHRIVLIPPYYVFQAREAIFGVSENYNFNENIIVNRGFVNALFSDKPIHLDLHVANLEEHRESLFQSVTCWGVGQNLAPCITA